MKKKIRFPPLSSKRIWGSLLTGLFIMALGFVFSGLHFLKTELQSAYRAEINDFRWIVLAQGEQIQIDEVGRFLNQLDQVENVLYHSPEQGLDRIRNEALFFDDLQDISPEMIPAAWDVHWNNVFDPTGEDIEILLNEILALPGVLDVALNEGQWADVQTQKKHLSAYRVIVSFFALLLSILAIVFIARAVFFGTVRFLGWRPSALLLFQDNAAWAMGWGLAWILLGRVSPALLIGGLMLSLFHLLLVSRLPAR